MLCVWLEVRQNLRWSDGCERVPGARSLAFQNLAMTGRYVNRADSPVRTLSDQVGERIAAAMAGRKPADVVPLNAISGLPSPRAREYNNTN